MNGFELDPPSLTFRSLTAQTQTVRVNDINYQYFALGHDTLPPSITITYDDWHVGPQKFVIKYDPDASNAPMFGDAHIGLKIGFAVNLSIQNVEYPVTFENEDRMQRPAETGGALACTICCTDFDEGTHVPKILTCGHTFCHHCLIGIEWSHNRPVQYQEDRQAYACPIDRQPITQPAALIPLNRIVLDLLQERKEQNAKQMAEAPRTVRDALVPCFEDPNHESAVYCQSCKESFCDVCYKIVHRSKTLSRHNAIPVSEKPPAIPKCPLHPDNDAEFICTNEKCEVGYIDFCQTCLKTDHFQHAHEPVQLTIKRNIGQLQSTVSELQAAERVVRRQIEQVVTCTPTFNIDDRDYQTARNRITERYERKRNAALGRFDDWAVEKKQALAEEKAKRQKMLEDIQETKLKATRALLTKTGLHKEISEFKEATRKLTNVKANDTHFFSMNDYVIDSDFESEPTSPVVLGSSPSLSPEPQGQTEVQADTMVREVEAEQPGQNQEEEVDADFDDGGDHKDGGDEGDSSSGENFH